VRRAWERLAFDGAFLLAALRDGLVALEWNAIRGCSKGKSLLVC
jgi:hypothetical protein